MQVKRVQRGCTVDDNDDDGGKLGAQEQPRSHKQSTSDESPPVKRTSLVSSRLRGILVDAVVSFSATLCRRVARTRMAKVVQ